jgi:outer membrane protein TolC
MLLLLAALLWAATSAAQEPLTLPQAVALTLANNPAVRAAEAGGKEADARLETAQAGYLPRVNVVESWQRGDQPVFVFSSLLSQRQFGAENFRIDALNHPEATNNFRTMFAVEQPIFDGTRTPSAVKAARIGQSIASLDRERLTADLTLATTRAYGQVLQAQAARRAADAAVVSAEEDLRRATRRRDGGLETEANVLAIDVQLAQMRERQIRAERDEAVARVELNQLMGLDLDRAHTLAETPAPAESTEDGRALEASAVAARPELQQAVLQRELALAQRGVAKSALLPQVSFQAGWELDGGTFGDRASAWLVGTQVSWNVFSGGASQARLREATFAAERAQAERDRLEAAVRVEVRSALARLEAARAREAVGRKAVEQARESQRIIRDRYDAGLAPASELLRANLSLVDAEALRVGALVDIVVSQAALDRAIGKASAERTRN